jgi:signal transduction histidine kinase
VDFSVYESGKEISIEETYTREQGEIIYLTSKSPIRNDDGDIIGLMGVALDITEIKRMERELKLAKEQAEAASRGKSEFIANMSHDIKTPLSGMVGLSELLRDRLLGKDQSIIQNIFVSGKQLLSFFENCLQIFKFENFEGNDIYFKEEFDIADMLEEIKELFDSAVLMKKLSLTVEIDPACPLNLLGSKAGLFRVLINLVSNAIKFTAAGAIFIKVKTLEKIDSEDEDEVLLEFRVEDTGIGIPQEQQHVIFEQFTRLTPSYKGIYEGHGIGLYIVDKFVKAMRGYIKVESEAQKGSAFIITIPFIKVTPNTDVASSNKKQNDIVPMPCSCLNILFVEDHPIAQLTQGMLLLSMGHRITLAASGEEALTLFSAESFDLIFMDMGLPGIQGDVTSQQIRIIEKEKGIASIPIIALTAHISEEMDQKIQERGIDVICSKPLSREKALRLIQQVMN